MYVYHPYVSLCMDSCVWVERYIYTDYMAVRKCIWWRGPHKERRMSEIAQKWGEAVAQRGFSQTPNYLILLNQFIDPDNRLSPLELLILIQLSGSWWKKEEMPFPSMRTLAQRCGTSERQVLRAISRLEEVGLLKRVKRRSKGLIASNSYDLSPLVATLQEVAKIYPNEFPRNVRSSPIPKNARNGNDQE